MTTNEDTAHLNTLVETLHNPTNESSENPLRTLDIIRASVQPGFTFVDAERKAGNKIEERERGLLYVFAGIMEVGKAIPYIVAIAHYLS